MSIPCPLQRDHIIAGSACISLCTLTMCTIAASCLYSHPPTDPLLAAPRNAGYWQCQPAPAARTATTVTKAGSLGGARSPPPKSGSVTPVAAGAKKQAQQPPFSSAPAGSCTLVDDWKQCGGTTGPCRALSDPDESYCDDSPWPDRCCRHGAVCDRR
jgi:hypothetical protein